MKTLRQYNKCHGTAVSEKQRHKSTKRKLLQTEKCWQETLESKLNFV